MVKPTRLKTEFESPRQSPGYLLWRVSNEWQRHIRVELKKLDLTHVQFVLLAGVVWFADQEQEANQAALAKHAAVDKMMVSDVLKTLEKKKFVRRRRSLVDGRALILEATEEGLACVQEAMQIVERINRAFFARSGWPREKIVQLLASLI